MRARIESMRRINPQAADDLNDIVKAINRGMISREESSRRMAKIFGITAAELLAASDEGEVRNQSLIDFIKTLRPRYKLAMLSNVRSRARLDLRFNSGELDDLFDVVVASGDVGLIKPERQIYEMVAEKLGVQPAECLMVDDLELYCEGARATGMSTILFKDTEQFLDDFRKLEEGLND